MCYQRSCFIFRGVACMNSHSVLWLLSIKTNYTAADRYQERKGGVKSVLTTLFPWRAIYYSNSALVKCIIKSISTSWVQGHDWHTRIVHMCTLAADFYKLRKEDAQYSSHDIPWDWNNRSLTSKHMLTHMLRGGNAKLASLLVWSFLPSAYV